MDYEFLVNNLIAYIREDIITLFCKQSILDKIGFLKRILSNFFK